MLCVFFLIVWVLVHCCFRLKMVKIFCASILSINNMKLQIIQNWKKRKPNSNNKWILNELQWMDTIVVVIFVDYFLIICCIPSLNAYNKIIVMMMFFWLNHCNQNNLPIRAFYRNEINKKIQIVLGGTLRGHKQHLISMLVNLNSIFTKFPLHRFSFVCVGFFNIFQSVKIVI